MRFRFLIHDFIHTRHPVPRPRIHGAGYSTIGASNFMTYVPRLFQVKSEVDFVVGGKEKKEVGSWKEAQNVCGVVAV